MNRLFIAFFLLINLLSVVARADVTVQATVDRDEMEPGDTFVYTVSLSTAERVNFGNPHLPHLDQFSVINEWTSEDVRSAMVVTPQGRREFRTVRSQNFNFQLQPRGEGTLRIGSAEIEVDGKTYNTKPIVIKVVKGANPTQRRRNQPSANGIPPGTFDEDDDDSDPFQQLLKQRMLPPQMQLPGGAPGGGGGGGNGFATQPVNPNEAFHIEVEVDKTDVFVSEQVTASFYLYTRGNIRDIDTLKYPNLHGFWKEDIEMATQLNFTEEIVNGIPYRKALLASYALFPTKAGRAIVDSYTAKCSVLIGDAFGFNSKVYQFEKSSPEVKVNVRDLPSEGRPADFSGAVGQFQVSADVGSQPIVANQPFVLKIRFDGRGNAKLIDIPPFQPPEGIELYDTQKDAKFFKNGTSYKEFSLSLIPRREGEFTIPAISSSVFDPVAKKYVTKTTSPITVHVAKGQGNPAGANSSSSPSDPAAGAKVSHEPVFPVISSEWRANRAPSLPRQLSFYVALLCVISIGLIVHAQREFGWGNLKKDLNKKLSSRMKKVRSLLAQNQWRAVGAEVTNICSQILGEIAGEGGADVELQKLFEKMPPSLRQELATPVSKLMNKFEALTFAPAEIVGSLKEKENLTPLVNEFEKQMRLAITLSSASEKGNELKV